MAVEWFGLPDDMKRHSGQLDYKLKGMTNDELRQTWMQSTVPLCESIGIKVPAHWDEGRERFVLDYAFPCEYDEDEKRWLMDEGEISWSQVFERWKGRGPRTSASWSRSRRAGVPGHAGGGVTANGGA
jgi:ring-1,2-phenylacetyl-CoA epoxidase subunit PaaA